MAEVLVEVLVTVFESLFNAAALFGNSFGTLTGAMGVADVFCLETALAPASAFAVLDSTGFVSLAALFATLPTGATALADGVLLAIALATGLAATGFLATTAFAFFLGSGLATAFWATTTFFVAVDFDAATFAVPFTATLEAGLAAAFAGAFAFTFAVDLALGLIAALAVLFVTVLLAGLLELLVVIFEADPNFRLAAFFSVALDFVKIFFALEATGGFAGFFMFSH